MTWRGGQGRWDLELVPQNECNLGHLVQGMTGSDAPTGPMSIVMACIIRYERLKRVVELGVWKGGTTVFLADACRDTGGTCFAVDKEPCGEARDRIRNLGLESPHCIFMHGDTLAVPLVEDIDLLFIDAGHRIDEFSGDWKRWTPQVRRGGWVFIDNAVSEQGVMQYLEQLVMRQDFQTRWQYIMSPASYGMAIMRKREAPDGEVLRARLEGRVL